MHPNTKGLIDQLTRLLRDAVLLPIPRGKKAPVNKGWQNTTRADMTEEYLERLDHRDNIGVLLGKASDGLCTIDIDDDEAAEQFLELNPKLADTLRTKGRRGVNLWVRIKGPYPPLGRLKERDQLTNVGEWRSDGGQTVIWGTHPYGAEYTRVVKAEPVTLDFNEIVWPPEWELPWIGTPEDELVRECGEPYTLGKNGAVKLNPVYFAAKFANEHYTLWQPDERAFYQYDEDSGLWQRTSNEQVKRQLAADLKAFADQVGLPHLVNRRSNAMLSDWAELLKGHVEKPGVFEKLSNVIHLKNGVLNLAKSPPELVPFSPDFYSRNMCPFEFREGAVCPTFMTELLGKALDEDDIDLLQRWCGAVLLGHNAAQMIMLLFGTAGGGKSTLTAILEAIIGVQNIVELRTDLLFERFELARFVGKTLLCGKDVPGDFLSHKGASALKKLVGHDLLSAELKRSNEAVMVRGDFNVVCTCNSRLRVRLDADVEAWRRRLLLIEYSLAKPEKPIRDFAEKLVETEGPGILLWMIKGAVLHLAELEEQGGFVLTEKQRQRVDDLLNESESVRHFAQDRLVKDENADVTTDELVAAYYEFCDEKGWRSETRRAVENQLPDIVLQVHRLNRRNDLKRGETTRRGYRGLRLCHCEQPF